MRLLVANWQDRLNPQAGGAEIHLHQTFSRLARNHDITLLVSGFDGAPHREVVDGMDVRRVGGRYTFNVAATRYYLTKLKGEKFDVFVEDLNKVPLYSPLFAREPVAMIVHHLFGRTAFEEASFPLAAATYVMEKPIARIYRQTPTVAVSPSTAADLRQRGLEGQIEVIPNGVDLGFFSPDRLTAKSPNPLILYLGRLERYKRVDLIVQAFARARAKFPDARLVIGGRGDARPELERLVRELGVHESVEFAGFVSDEQKRELFRRAWVHMLTSSKEGWGITNIEAAACGTLTIASDAPGLRDSVEDGVTGYLVKHGDVAGLAARLEDVIGHPELRERLSLQAIQFAQSFAWDASAARMETFLQGVNHAGQHHRPSL